MLSRHWRDVQARLVLEYWISTDTGARCLRFEQQEAVAFCPREQAQYLPSWPELRSAPVALKHFNQTPAVAVYARSYKALRRLKDYCQSQDITLWEADIKPSERFTMERFIFGSLALRDDGQQTLLLNPKIKPAHYQPNLKLLSVDIETSMATASQPEQLYSIGFVGQFNGASEKRVFMLGDASLPRPVWLSLFPQLKDLLLAANDWLQAYDPDVLIGWHVLGFDFRVLERVYREQGVPFAWGRGQQPVRLRDGQNNNFFCDIDGRVVVDGIDALKAASYQFESFSLEFVGQALLARGKKIDADKLADRGQAIGEMFQEDKIALAKYNLQDCQLVLDIFAHTHILNYLIQRSRLTGHTLDRIGGSVAAFEYLYLPKLHRAGYIAPNMGEGLDDFKAPGGLVMDSQPGIYKDVLVLDFKSLYPSIIRTFKIDPMGLIEGLLSAPEDTIDGFHGARFHRDKHFLPDMITRLWAERETAKENKDAAVSQAIKIIMNSFYGILGSKGCRFFDARLASAITERGHQVIQDSAAWIERQGYEVIYGDTDSVFVYLKKDHSLSQAQKVGRSLQDRLNHYWRDRLQQEFKLECDLEIEYERHYRHFLMPTIRGSELGSKKRYAGITSDEQLIFKGLEAVRSDWTALAKEVQTNLYRLIFHGQAYEDYLLNIVQEVKAGKRDRQLVYKKRIRRQLDDYVKNVPPQIQAARKAEVFYQEHNQSSQYRHGGWIEYVMTLAGPEPLTYIQHPLDYQHYIDKQIAPVADGILYFLQKRFHNLIDPQQDIFSR
ncbi:MAG: DNA polymerase II [Bermanella sp.]